MSESIQSAGGKARAEALTPEQRSEIASVAGKARWGKGFSMTVPLDPDVSVTVMFNKDPECVHIDRLMAHLALIKQALETTQ